MSARTKNYRGEGANPPPCLGLKMELCLQGPNHNFFWKYKHSPMKNKYDWQKKTIMLSIASLLEIPDMETAPLNSPAALGDRRW